MQMFLYICEFLGVEPKDFFDEHIENPNALNKAVDTLKSLPSNQLALLTTIAKDIK